MMAERRTLKRRYFTNSLEEHVPEHLQPARADVPARHGERAKMSFNGHIA
jgi:hypothetical protein